MQPILEVRDLSKSFGSLKAVSHASFEVGEGEIFGIAGPNGSGKSTLFNAITAIPFSADSGTIRFAGQDIGALGPHAIARLGLARTFQRETAFESLTARQNMVIGAAFGGEKLPRDEIGKRIDRALDLVGLDRSDGGRMASELSVFDRKRLMLAGALVMGPKLMLLDEPASSLTKPEIEETVRIVRRLNENGISIVIIEHVLPALLSLSQRLMVLNQGTILVIGEPQAVVRDPQVIEAYLGRRRAGDAAAS